MNDHVSYVSIETAKMLKEAGFDWECKMWVQWHPPVIEDGDHPGLIERDIDPKYTIPISETYPRPTLDVAQRWLREVKNLILLIDITPSYCNGKPMSYKFVIHVSCGNHICGEWKDTYEEALEAGIKKCLTLILNKDESK